MQFRGMAWDATDRREYPRADCGPNLFFTLFVSAHPRGVICGVIARTAAQAQAEARRQARAVHVPETEVLLSPEEDDWSEVLREHADRFERRS